MDRLLITTSTGPLLLLRNWSEYLRKMQWHLEVSKSFPHVTLCLWLVSFRRVDKSKSPSHCSKRARPLLIIIPSLPFSSTLAKQTIKMVSITNTTFFCISQQVPFGNNIFVNLTEKLKKTSLLPIWQRLWLLLNILFKASRQMACYNSMKSLFPSNAKCSCSSQFTFSSDSAKQQIWVAPPVLATCSKFYNTIVKGMKYWTNKAKINA